MPRRGCPGCAAAAIVLVGACGRIGFGALANRGDAGGDAGASLAITPGAVTINVGSKVTFDVTGGAPPYTLTADGDGVTQSLTFIAPTEAGTATVHVQDAGGLTADAIVDYRGDRLFVAGGDVAGAIDASVVTSTDGKSWTAAGNLPAPRANGALVVFDDKMFYLGGLDSASVPTNTIYVSTDGATWTLAGTLPTVETGFTSIVHAGELWYVGGVTDVGNGTAAYHSVDGTTWLPVAPIALGRHEHDVISHAGSLYVIGGHGDAGFLDDVQWTTDGAAWQQRSGVLTFATDFAAAASLGGHAIRVCGSTCTQTETSSDLLTWTAAQPLPDGSRTGPALVAFAGQLVLVGGATTVLATTDATSWTQLGTLPAARTRTSAVQFTPH